MAPLRRERAIHAGRNTEPAPERLREVRRRSEPDAVAHLGHGQRRGDEQLGGSVEPAANQISMRGLAHLLAERAGQMERTERHLPRQRAEVDVVRKVLVQVLTGPHHALAGVRTEGTSHAGARGGARELDHQLHGQHIRPQRPEHNVGVVRDERRLEPRDLAGARSGLPGEHLREQLDRRAAERRRLLVGLG